MSFSLKIQRLKEATAAREAAQLAHDAAKSRLAAIHAMEAAGCDPNGTFTNIKHLDEQLAEVTARLEATKARRAKNAETLEECRRRQAELRVISEGLTAEIAEEEAKEATKKDGENEGPTGCAVGG